jgi:galactose mutarotase-like enzyme
MVSYGLIKNKLICEYKVTNFGTENMPFSIGAHPGFNCPIVPGEKLEDYKLIFDQKENLPRLLLENGLFTGETEPFLQNENELTLHSDLFNKDAIVIENFKSKSLSLVSQKSNHSLKVTIEGFPYLGIWAKPGAKFVCIEPWFGLADSTSSTGDIENKKGIILLEPKKEFSCSFSMEAN